MDAKTLVLYLCNNNQVKKMSLSMQLKYVTTASPVYYVDASLLRRLWHSCSLDSVHETTVIWSLHCCIAIVIQLSYEFDTVHPVA